MIMTKPENAEQRFDDGLLIRFPESKPKHLSFKCMTNDENLESCDTRLFKLNETDTEEKLDKIS